MKNITKRIILGILIVLPVATLAATTLPNPLPSADPNELVANIIRTALGVVGALALVMFIYGGFTLLISGGSQERVKKGRDVLMWATIGLIVVFGSYGITEAIFKALSN